MGSSNKPQASGFGLNPASKTEPPSNNTFGDNAASVSSGFGSAGPGTFGTSTTSTFATLGGSNFGSGFGGRFGSTTGSGLKTFAAPNGPGVIGTGVPSSRAFGSPPGDDDDEEEDGDEEGQRRGEPKYGEAQDHEDKRFHEQEG